MTVHGSEPNSNQLGLRGNSTKQRHQRTTNFKSHIICKEIKGSSIGMLNEAVLVWHEIQTLPTVS